MSRRRPTSFALLLYPVLAIALAACSQMTVNLPAVANNQEQHPGHVIWHDLLTHDMEATKTFYTGLFGWEFSEITGAFGKAGYQLISHEGQPIGGAVDTSSFKNKHELSQWVSIFATQDLGASVETVKALGGNIEGGPQSVGDRGSLAVVKDAQGAIFALLQTSTGDPSKTPNKPGYFLWQELWNNDGNGEFYRELLGAKAEQGALTDGKFDYYSVGNQPAFSVLKTPLDGLKPTWVTYIQVEDVNASAEKAEALGGRVVVAPQTNPIGGSLAVILDPSGAGFVIQTWQTEKQAGTKQ